MKDNINVTKVEDLVTQITELVGGISDNEELLIEIEVKQVDREHIKEGFYKACE
ncbi:MAG: hypothetical protein K6G88_10240 [Lachnospiraceae bacterium]|nr:hypothetical protein [Lachnospiraceae bacterium]